MARGWEHHGCEGVVEVLDIDVVLPQVDQQRLHSRTKPRGIKNEAWRDRFGSVRGGPVRRQSRQRDDQGRQEDRKTDGGGDGWEKGGGGTGRGRP